MSTCRVHLQILFAVVLAGLPSAARAQAPFQQLLARVPESANAVVLLNVEKAKQSPTGKAEGLTQSLEKAFSDGLIPVPPGAGRFVLAAEMDLEFMTPIWEAAVIDLAETPNMNLVAKAYHGETDSIENLPAVVLPQDAYVLKLADKTVGAMSPANRQAVVRWVRQQSKSGAKLSPYLERAAGYSDRAGSEIIMALDLDGMISPQRIGNYLQSVAWLEEAKVDVAKLKRSLSGVEGIRIGVRLGNPPNGSLAVDFRAAPSISASSAKRLFLEYLTAKGMLIEDFEQWQPSAQGNSISLSGRMSPAGIRKLMSLIEIPSPTPGNAVAHSTASNASANGTASAEPAVNAGKTKAYFQKVTSMFDDLKDDMKEAKNLASTSLFFDKYARQIERMPTMDIDPEMLNYGAYVAQQMRQSSAAVRGMGIRTGVRSAQINSSNTGSDDYYYYGNYGYGRYGGMQGAMNDIKAVEQQRGVVRAEEKGAAAANVHQIRAEVITATSDIRRKMTEKYRVQF